MTGVGGRPELIIEGTNDLNGQWKVRMFNFLLCVLSGLSIFNCLK